MACAPAKRTAETDASSDSGPTNETAPASVTLDGVTWVIGWDTSGLTPTDTGGWSLQRDDGLELELTTGYLVVHTLVLETCDTPTARTPPPHGLPDHPSRTLQPVALALHTLEPHALGGSAFEPLPFCEVGIAMFRGTTGDPGMPEDGSMDDLSFAMTGRVRSSPDADWTPLPLSSNLLVERDLQLDEYFTVDSEHAGAVEATVVLHPAHLLDGLSLDGDPARLALDAMANLADTATVTLTPAR